MVIRCALWLILLPISCILHVAGFRRLTVLGDRIGHLAAEVDCFLKLNALGHDIDPELHYFLAIPEGQVANRHLLQYWAVHLPVVSHPIWARLAEIMSQWFVMRKDVSSYVLRLDATAEIYSVFAKWGNRQPILQLSQNDDLWLRTQLRALGVPDNSWFVCVHIREPGYSPGDELAHGHRNASVENVLPAIEAIVRNGGWCIRMGDPSMTPLPKCKNTVDYAHHPQRSARLDIALCARCHFFLGNSSGLAFVSAAFGVPSALANMIPVSALGLLPTDLSIPKLLRDPLENRYLHWPEVFGSAIGNYRYASQYQNDGIDVEENSADEIEAMVTEMIERLRSQDHSLVLESDLDSRFKALLRPGHYSYGTVAHVSKAFLNKHRSLLDSYERHTT
jgi:putative glycosyltransferase (TIGR04372 family)